MPAELKEAVWMDTVASLATVRLKTVLLQGKIWLLVFFLSP